MMMPLLLGALVAQAPAIDGAPVIDSRGVTLYAAQQRDSRPRLVGDFNGWGRYPEAEGTLGGTMERVSGTRWYRATVELARDARVEYGFVYGDGEPMRDPQNPRTTVTFGMTRSVVEMPDYAPSPHVGSVAEPRGALDAFSLGDGRRVQVYTPPGYPDAAPYPVAYFNDGDDYVREVGTPAIVESALTSGTVRPLIAVFVDPIDRSSEYRGAPAFLALMLGELVARIDRDYETIASPSGRAVVGGSRGALGALHVAWNGPTVFGHCGMLSPAITPNGLLGRIWDGETRPIHLFVQGGIYDVRFIGDYHNALDTLSAKGYRVVSRTASIGHSPTSWRHYIPEMLAHFFPPD